MKKLSKREALKRFLPSIIFLGLGVYPLVMGSINYFSFICIALALGLLKRIEIVRKFAIFFCILSLVFFVFVFFPPFTGPNEKVILQNQPQVIRILALLGIESLIVVIMLCLKNKFGNKDERKVIAGSYAEHDESL